MDSNEFTITYDVAEEGAYCEGFADGYARAWKDCWAYVHDLLIERKAQEQAKPTPEGSENE